MNSTWSEWKADAILGKPSWLLTAASLGPLTVISSTVEGRHLLPVELSIFCKQIKIAD